MEGNADITSMVLCIGIAEAASLCKAVAEVAFITMYGHFC